MKTIQKDMSIQERYNVIINNLHEAGMADNEIVELFNDVRENMKQDTTSMSLDEKINHLCGLDKWITKCIALIQPCGLKKSLLAHIKDYIRETEFMNSLAIQNDNQQSRDEDTEEVICKEQAIEEISYTHLEGDSLLKTTKEFIGLLIKSNSAKGLIYTDKGNINVQLRKKGKYYKKMIVEYNNQKKVCDYDAKAFILDSRNLYNILKECGF